MTKQGIDLAAAARLWLAFPDMPDLTMRQAAVVGLLAEGRVAPEVRTFAAELGVGKPVVCRIFDMLERDGWGERRPAENDRRVITFALTPKGRALRDAMIV